MKNCGLLNPALLDAVASLGHTQYLVICDAGLPIPEGIKRVDVSLVPGTPCFDDVLRAICSEMVVESYIYATEMEEKNPSELQTMRQILKDVPGSGVSHEEFKALTRSARCIVRTGETKPYANVILVGGVNF